MDAANSQSKRNSAASDLDSLDMESLKALILAQRSEIENLNLLVQKLRRMHFGPRSEKLQPDIDQLELRLEDLEMNAASVAPAIAVTVAAAGMRRENRRANHFRPNCRARSKPSRRRRRSVRIAVASCVRLARMCPKYSNTFRLASR